MSSLVIFFPNGDDDDDADADDERERRSERIKKEKERKKVKLAFGEEFTSVCINNGFTLLYGFGTFGFAVHTHWGGGQWRGSGP